MVLRSTANIKSNLTIIEYQDDVKYHKSASKWMELQLDKWCSGSQLVQFMTVMFLNISSVVSTFNHTEAEH